LEFNLFFILTKTKLKKHILTFYLKKNKFKFSSKDGLEAINLKYEKENCRSIAWKRTPIGVHMYFDPSY